MTFISEEWKRKCERCRKPLTHKFKGLIKVKHFGSDPQAYRQWSVDSSFTLLVFHEGMHHAESFARHGLSEHDMLMTGNANEHGISQRGGSSWAENHDDSRELFNEIRRLYRDGKFDL